MASTTANVTWRNLPETVVDVRVVEENTVAVRYQRDKSGRLLMTGSVTLSLGLDLDLSGLA